MKKILVIFVLLIMVFSGCSKLGGSASSGSDKEVDKSGYGLEVDFDFDTKLVKDSKKLIYNIKLKNTGLKPVVLTRENFKLTTIEKNNNNNYYFSEQSLNNFYEKVFSQQPQLILINDQEKIVEGTILIDDSFYSVATNTNLEYLLEITYDYETIFANNLELNEEYGLFKLNNLDKVSQAAPVQISDIKLIPGESEKQYILEYTFEDRGKGYFAGDKTEIEINEINLKFGTKTITNDCTGIYKKGDNKIDEADMSSLKIKNDEQLFVRCDLQIDDTRSFTTKTSGDFSYEYKVKLGSKITLRN